jgi:hypothetical protein
LADLRFEQLRFPFANLADLWDYGRLFLPQKNYGLRNHQDWWQAVSRRGR